MGERGVFFPCPVRPNQEMFLFPPRNRGHKPGCDWNGVREIRDTQVVQGWYTRRVNLRMEHQDRARPTATG